MASPCPGYKITTPFGKKGGWAAGYHTGDDYAAPSGAKVVASRKGRVTHVGWGGFGSSYGAHVVIDHGNGVRSLYAHLSRTTIRTGATVSEGQQIGNVGTTGNSTGPHLHYEERVSPYGYYNHRKPQYNRQSSGGGSSSGHPTYLSKLKFGQRDSESVKNLQRKLNAHKMPGGRNLPITGYYGPQTDDEVRLCQRLHLPPADPPRKSYVGPKQAAHLKLPDVRK